MIFQSLNRNGNLLHITANTKKKPPKWLAKFLTESKTNTNIFVIDVDTLQGNDISSLLILVRKYYISKHQISLCDKLIHEYKSKLKDPNAKFSMAKVFGKGNGVKVLQLQGFNNLLPKQLENELCAKANIPQKTFDIIAIDAIKSTLQTKFDGMQFATNNPFDTDGLYTQNTHLKIGMRYVIDRSLIVPLPNCEANKKGYYHLLQNEIDAEYLAGLPPTKYTIFEGEIIKIYTAERNKQVLVTCSTL